MVTAVTRAQHARRPSICFITTLPYQVNVFLAEHIEALLESADVTVITNGAREDLLPALRDRVRHHRVAIERPIRPIADLTALVRIVRILRAQRLDLVQSMTPKAGLLGMLAARLAGIPVRVHWFTGQVWQTTSGQMRFLLKGADRLVARLATTTLVDSPSQREYLIKEGIAPPSRMHVLGKGSVRGVDAERFRPDCMSRESVRAELGLRTRDIVALFVGRLTKEKGLLELAVAMRELRDEVPHLHTVVLGFEEGDFVEAMQAAVGRSADRLHVLGYSHVPERYMAAADFLVLPSHREGFGSTVIEAAACGVPAIGTQIHGLTDAIIDGETGVLVPPGDSSALRDAMRNLASDAKFRRRLSDAAMARARRDFGTEILTGLLKDRYGQLLGTPLT